MICLCPLQLGRLHTNERVAIRSPDLTLRGRVSRNKQQRSDQRKKETGRKYGHANQDREAEKIRNPVEQY
jgi:hypothetical protein